MLQGDANGRQSDHQSGTGGRRHHPQSIGGTRMSDWTALLKADPTNWLLEMCWGRMHQTDILEIVDVLTELGVHDSRMDEGINIVRAKQDDMDGWRMENTYSSDDCLSQWDRRTNRASGSHSGL
jgi:hypothetical protein